MPFTGARRGPLAARAIEQRSFRLAGARERHRLSHHGDAVSPLAAVCRATRAPRRRSRSCTHPVSFSRRIRFSLTFTLAHCLLDFLTLASGLMLFRARPRSRTSASTRRPPTLAADATLSCRVEHIDDRVAFCDEDFVVAVPHSP